MNVKGQDPTDLIAGLLPRSTCAVQVAACLVDEFGVYAWGWNSSGSTGMGEHAEAHCFRRANHRRLSESTLYVIAQRLKNGVTVSARPCLECQPLAAKCARTLYRDKDGIWKQL